MLGSPIDYGQGKKHNVVMLTWVRGIAALLVVVTHVRQGAWKAYGDEVSTYEPIPILHGMLSLGAFGVALFFALSGCTLYLGYNKIVSGTDTWHFYIRRFARIYPAFVVSLLCYLAFRPVFQHYYIAPEGEWVEAQFLQDFSLRDLLHYLTLTSNFRMDEVELFNNAFWSLPVEFQFYLLFPLLLGLHRKVPIVGLVALSGITYVVSILLKLNLIYTAEALWQFAGGMLCGHLMLTKHLRLDWRLGFGLLFALMSAAWYITLGTVPNFPGLYSITYLGIIAVVIVFVSVNIQLPDFKGPVVRFLDNLGEISYSIYLFHNLCIAAWLLVALQLGLTGVTRLAVVGVGTLICVWLLANVTYRWVEKPGMDAGKRLTSTKRLPVSADVTSVPARASVD